MRTRLAGIVLLLLSGLLPAAWSQEPIKPVRMGTGGMTFDTVPGGIAS